jgi:hypothetical protein
VQAGADVDLADDSRQSAYLIATSEVGDDPRLLELTLAAGADINAKDSDDGTGLIRAAERAHVTIVERLLQADIDRDHSTVWATRLCTRPSSSARADRPTRRPWRLWSRAESTSTSRTAAGTPHSPTPTAAASARSRRSCARPGPVAERIRDEHGSFGRGFSGDP